MRPFSTLLVANRGEIALRVMRSARTVGMRTVAVYSEADRDAPHMRYADDAVLIGPGPVGESYLRGEKIIDAAKQSGAEAIHPGYGFLSENAAFAQMVADAGLIFVGPSPEAIDLMGDKARAKRQMIKSGVPCVPGYEGEDQADARFLDAANEIGFPVMVKAAAGGGGRGMRLVHDAKDLPDALALARSEAENAFGAGELIIEKAIIRPRHVEVQVFGDTHGTIIHLGERDCSVQRRHQKVLEEAPCPVMTPTLREEMGAAAVKAAESVDYCGAGTVEFLLDDNGQFYFLEMNTRLQVEHPVTELVTGLDLVALQLRVAQGEPLGMSQKDVTLTGHAIEARLYAEDPVENFLPSTGPIRLWRPGEGDGVRVDDGVATGGDISPFYDPMVAKVIAYGTNREQARLRLVGALLQTSFFGPRSNRDFLVDALQRESFASGKATTAFINETYGEDFSAFGVAPMESYAVAAVLQHYCARRESLAASLSVNPELLDWSSSGRLESVVQYSIGGSNKKLRIQSIAQNVYEVFDGDHTHEITIVAGADTQASLIVNERKANVRFYDEGDGVFYLDLNGRTLKTVDLTVSHSAGDKAASDGVVTASMHGVLIDVFVDKGDDVKVGDKLAVLEAMKMQHVFEATIDGVVVDVAAAPGAQLAVDDLILEIRPADAEGVS